MERRLTSEQIDKLLDEIVTEDFIINALKEVEPLKWAKSQYEFTLNNGISNFSFNDKSSKKIKLEEVKVEIGNYNYAA